MNDDRKRTLLLFSLILIMFFLFSFFLLKDKNNKSKEYMDTNQVNNSSKIDEKPSDINQVKKDTMDIVEKFVRAYHLISKDNNLNRLDSVKNLIVEPLYLEMNESVKLEENMPKNGYVYRNINDLTIVDFKNNDDGTIMWTANAWSDWSDEKNNITDENIMTKYTILLINENGNWKIGQLSSENI